jgi:Xaa-Pro dipeptidase
VNRQEEIAEKTNRLIEILNAEGLGGVLINSQANFAWLSGGKSNGINLSIENGACFLFVRTDGKKFALANNIEMPRLLSEEISADDFEPIEFSWQEEKSSGDFIFEKAKSLLPRGAALASDLVLHREIRPVENLISLCRFDLTEAEIARFRNLGRDAGAALGNALKTVNPGETELEIAQKTRNELAKFNINPVVALVGADERVEKYRHPVPTENVLKKVLLIAVCARREGLIASLSRIVCFGAIPEGLKRKTEAAAYVFAKLLSETKQGKTGAELYQIAARAYEEKGFAGEINRHHQGGAAGYKTRDWVAHPRCQDKVFPNQAFAWNPSISGTKVEETCIAFEDEIEVITASPNWAWISVEAGGREYFSPDVMSI